MRNPCCDKKHKNKYEGAWSKLKEDEKLIEFAQTHGEIGDQGLPRCRKSRRLRWVNFLRPNVNKQGNFKEDEEDLIIKLHSLLGNRWSLIAGRLPGRTDSEIKNYWNSHLKKKLAAGRPGVNPINTHLVKRSQPIYGTHKSEITVVQPSDDRQLCDDHAQMISAEQQSDRRVSDAASFCTEMEMEMEMESAREQQLPDLNLDPPTISLPGHDDPTLILFQ